MTETFAIDKNVEIDQFFALVDNLIDSYETEVALVLPKQFTLDRESDLASRITWKPPLCIGTVTLDFQQGSYHRDGKPDVTCLSTCAVKNLYLIPTKSCRFQHYPYKELIPISSVRVEECE